MSQGLSEPLGGQSGFLLPCQHPDPRERGEEGERERALVGPSCPLSYCGLSPVCPRARLTSVVLGASKGPGLPRYVCPLALHWVGYTPLGASLSLPSVLPVFVWVSGLPTASRSPGYKVRAEHSLRGAGSCQQV